MNIYTITLNPAFDIHAYTKHFVPYHENLVSVISKDVGGKGLNISKALNAVGINNSAVIVLGKENGADFKNLLLKDDINAIIFEKEGSIRENITLHSEDSPETRISFSGFSLEEDILSEIENKLVISNDSVITLTGRVPDGISEEKVIAFLLKLKSNGAKLVIDSKSISLSDLYAIKPWLIKPNEEEISAYFGCEINTLDEALIKARDLASNGIENVMVTLGDVGAVLVSDGRAYHAVPPKVNAVSTIGAGDSAIAGFISAFICGYSPADCLKNAVSFGTAACLSVGTKPPETKDILAILNRTKVNEIYE